MPVPQDFRDRILAMLQNLDIDLDLPTDRFEVLVEKLYWKSGGPAGYLTRKFMHNEIKGEAFQRAIVRFADELGIPVPEFTAQMRAFAEQHRAEIEIVEEEAAAAGMTYQEYYERSLALLTFEVRELVKKPLV